MTSLIVKKKNPQGPKLFAAALKQTHIFNRSFYVTAVLTPRTLPYQLVASDFESKALKHHPICGH